MSANWISRDDNKSAIFLSATTKVSSGADKILAWTELGQHDVYSCYFLPNAKAESIETAMVAYSSTSD